jgi:multiple sugar transport system substrate-binding protein
MLENVGWLPNRQGVDYSPVTTAVPGFAGFLEVPEDYEYFTLPAIGPIEELLTRIAAQLTNAFGNPALAGDDEAIAAFLQGAEDEANQILRREGLLAE